MTTDGRRAGRRTTLEFDRSNGGPMNTLPPALVNFPRECFPIRLEAFDLDTKNVVWAARVERPGAVKISLLARQLGHPVSIRASLADGDSFEGPNAAKTGLTNPANPTETSPGGQSADVPVKLMGVQNEEKQ